MRQAFIEALEQRSLLSAYVVDNAGDVVDGNHGPGEMALREAIELANANLDADSITFDSALAGQTIALALGQLEIEADVAISGLGASSLTIDGGGASRVFRVDSGATVLISGLTITGGSTVGNGGGIYNDGGTLTVMNSTISGNAAVGGGGGIFGDGGLVSITSSTVSGNTAANGAGIHVESGTLVGTGLVVSGNTASDSGGGILGHGGAITLTNSTITGNEATSSWGGGLYCYGSAVLRITNSTVSGGSAGIYGGGVFSGSGTLTITGSTISGNTAEFGGGGVYSSGSLTIKNSTVSGNASPSGQGGGVFNDRTGATLDITNSTLSGNSAGSGGGVYNGAGSSASLVSTIVALNPGGDINGLALDSGSTNNLIGDAGSAGGLSNGVDGNIVGTDPKLQPLADNGGLTRTHGLGAGSPARDHGSNPLNFGTDQRGAGFVRQFGSGVDIGAFEYGATRDDYPDAGEWADAANVSIDPNAGDGVRGGWLEIPHDTDLFRFVAAGTGTAVVTLDVTEGFDGWFELYDASHNFIARQNAKPTGRDEVRSLPVSANQVYFVLVGGWRNPSGLYTLEIDGPAAPDDYADANAWDAATNIPIDPNSGNGARAGELEAAGDTDLLKFTAAGVGTTVITLDVGAYFDGRFKVYTGAHVKLNPGDESVWINDRAIGGDESWSFEAGRNHVYYILIGGWRVPGGSYTIRVDGQPAPDDFADGGDWPNARNIALDSSGDGSRAGSIEAAGDTDLFKFTAPGTGSVTVTLDAASGFDGWFEIYDSSHNLVAPRRNSKATGGDEVLSFNALAGQTYFILIGGWRNPSGGYDVLVNA